MMVREGSSNLKNAKKCLMTQYPCARGRAYVCKNIGDYIQSIASKQFIDNLDGYIEQEEANVYSSKDGRKARLIMNGWFQWRAENWPPSQDIIPLLVSMHISPLKKDLLLTTEGIEFLKKNAPVGCRDLYTEKLLKSVGVPAYFSACVTLTLGKKYSVSVERKKGACFVDPYFEVPEIYVKDAEGKVFRNNKLLLKTLWYYLFHFRVINKLSKKEFFGKYSPIGFLDRNESKYRAKYKATLFYKSYSKMFSKKLLLNAEYITHFLDVDMKKDTNEDLLNYAECLIKKYSYKKLVVTSRIHAGLPCLAVETPVIFIANDEVISESGKFNTPGRLDGLLELFRVMNISTNGKFNTADKVLKKIRKFSEETIFQNKQDYKIYAERLSRQLEAFMEN